MKKDTLFKVAKYVIPIASAGISLAAGWLSDKKNEETIAEKVSEKMTEALAEKAKEEL